MRRLRRGFVLLEVIISLTILAVTVAAVLRSFSQSLSALRILEVQTQAEFFAQQLLDEFEINPPREGVTEMGFGDDYAAYSYVVDVEYIAPDYDDTNRHDRPVVRYLAVQVRQSRAFEAAARDHATYRDFS